MVHCMGNGKTIRETAMKRTLALLLTLAVLFAFLPASALADGFSYDTIPTPNMLVVDANDLSHVFYERAADQPAYPASTTKIMTCLLALESGNLDATVTVGDEVAPFTNYSSLMGLVSGETVTLRDLIYGLMLVSGNDAAAAIAVHVGGSIERFVEMMNQKAQQLGMTSTHFQNPHGVQNENHYTTARDMARLTAYAMQNPEFLAVDRTQTYSVPPTNKCSTAKELVTSNRLLRAVEGDPVNTVYPFAIGGKTGDTDTAGKCLVAIAEKDGARVITVLFGDKVDMYGGDKVTNNLARFVNAAAIFEHVFSTDYATITGAELGLNTSFTLPVPNGNAGDLNEDGTMNAFVRPDDLILRLTASEIGGIRANASAITPEVHGSDGLSAPIVAGQTVGSVSYTFSGRVLFSAPLYAERDINIASEGAIADADTPYAETAAPLIDRKHKEWGSRDVLTIIMVILIILLAALVVLFIYTEKKRAYERKRRRARAKANYVRSHMDMRR